MGKNPMQACYAKLYCGKYLSTSFKVVLEYMVWNNGSCANLRVTLGSHSAYFCSQSSKLNFSVEKKKLMGMNNSVVIASADGV